MDFTDQLMFMETKIINYALDKFSRNALREHFHCSISYTEPRMEQEVVGLLKLISVWEGVSFWKKKKCQAYLDYDWLYGSNKTIHNLSGYIRDTS